MGEAKKEIELEIAHILFVDIVGYSKLSINDQHAAVEELNQVVRASEQSQRAEAASRLLKIPTGDGMALVFYKSPEEPAQCAVEISRALKTHLHLQIRMGIHSGPVSGVVDVNERMNVAGAGINTAQRVMDCGDAGHILLSKHVAEDLEGYERWRPLLHELGACEVKHSVRVEVSNLYSDEVGNPHLPKKFRALKKHRVRVRLAQGIGGLLVLAAVIAAFVLLWRRPAAPVLATVEKSIAVLPFQNLSGDLNNAYFADGIHDEILTRLSKITALRVISRTSTQHYKSAPDNLPEIAKELGVGHFLEGSVQKSGDAVRVNVQLIKAANDSQLWADTFDRKLTDIFSVESEVAKNIADQLQAKLTGREEQALAVKPTNNPEAYDSYLRGLVFSTHSVYSDAPIRSAINFFGRATQLDPNFAVAWARLSRANAFLYFRQADTSASCRDAAKSALENAQRLEPDSPDTLLALGYYQYWVLRDFGLATTTFKLISKVLPSSSDVPFAVGAIARRRGHWDESIASLDQALVVDPRNTELLIHTADTYVMVRKFAEALKLYGRALDIVPNDPDLLLIKAGIYQAQGNVEEAAKILEALNPANPNASSNPKLVMQSLLERNFDKAVRLLRAQQDRSHFSGGFYERANPMNLAFVEYLAGDNAGAKISAEEARQALEALCESQPDNAIFAANLSQAYALLNNKEAALKEAERAITLLPTAKDAVDGPEMEENLALVEMLVGENSRSISILSRLLDTPYDGWYYLTPITPALLHLDPTWDGLRADASFRKLCQQK